MVIYISHDFWASFFLTWVSIFVASVRVSGSSILNFKHTQKSKIWCVCFRVHDMKKSKACRLSGRFKVPRLWGSQWLLKSVSFKKGFHRISLFLLTLSFLDWKGLIVCFKSAKLFINFSNYQEALICWKQNCQKF